VKAGADFYERWYSQGVASAQRRVRLETYDEDLDQSGWLDAAEAREFASWLGPDVKALLDVACGSGGVSALLADHLDANVTGVDMDERAIAAARDRNAPGCDFRVLDANQPLPFLDGTFDAVFSNDSVHRLYDRRAVLTEWARLLAPGGRILYTEGLVLTGPVSNEEVAQRTFMGFFVLSPPGANERAIEEAGLVLERAEDRSEAVASVGARMRAARERYRIDLVPLEGEDAFERFQEFLGVAVSLASERRLSRWVFVARKPRNVATRAEQISGADRRAPDRFERARDVVLGC
jgi:SAM-dependent methyltransferase